MGLSRRYSYSISMKVLLLTVMVTVVASMTTTHRPAPNLHGNPLYKLVQHEVTALLQAHPDLTQDTCDTKCDALLDLMVRGDEKITDKMCHYACAHALRHPMTAAPGGTNRPHHPTHKPHHPHTTTPVFV